MNQFMIENPQYLTDSNEEGVERVKKSTKYAFLMESTSIEYNTKRECNLKKLAMLLMRKLMELLCEKVGELLFSLKMSEIPRSQILHNMYYIKSSKF